MAQKEKIHSKVEEAEQMVEELQEKYPSVLWRIRPNMITVLGIENKERTKSNNTLAKVIPIKGAEKSLMKLNNLDTRYIIELYWSDWKEWSLHLKQWIIMHELLHVSEEVGKTVKHDCEDFRILIDKVGVDWVHSKELPNLMDGDVAFDLDLRPGVPDEDPTFEESDEIPEETEDSAEVSTEELTEEEEASAFDPAEEGDVFDPS